MDVITFSNFKLYYKPVINKTAKYWNKERTSDQLHRNQDIDRPSGRTSTHFNDSKTYISWQKEGIFSACCSENWSAACKSCTWSSF